MSYFEAFILALIQGLTEFLPISSSAHLILPSAVLGWEDQGLAFDVAVHVGTLAAVMIYFRSEVVSLLSAFFASIFKGDCSKKQTGVDDHSSNYSCVCVWFANERLYRIVSTQCLGDSDHHDRVWFIAVVCR